jgi:hypothetical protein
MHDDPPRRQLGRYEIADQLGQGGMAVVYRVLDPATGRFVAAKQLFVHAQAAVSAELSARFEREFHTLTELSHPRIIEVYDYALDPAGPFYTMELLDGGDLMELSPLPWQKTCALLHDVCSSLALLHSRRLVHCDVSPRNVRCTKDGRAKLIDFGAMVPMGRGLPIVGTPSFTAPEVVARSELDGRTDLFSLGATLYYALTGRVAFAARDFSTLIDAWSVKPRPPSHFAPGVPEALDRLTLSLLSLQAGERPRNAFEVMERLAVIGGLERRDTIEVSDAYLSAPVLVGRQPLMAAIQDAFVSALHGQGRSLIIRGSAGLGRSRVLESAVIAAKLRGLCVVRGSADAARGEDFAVAQTLCEQLLEALPELARDAAQAENVQEQLLASELGEQPRATRQDALSRWLLALSKRRTIALAVDDVQRIDEPSAALLAQCAAQSGDRGLVLLLTQVSESELHAGSALEILAGHSQAFELSPLSEDETVLLLTSVFGDVPHIGVLGHALQALAGGNPGLCLQLARHLVDNGTLRYAAGNCTLPSRLERDDLPTDADAALRARVAALGASARALLEAHALASHEAFTPDDYVRLSPATRVEQALSELVAREFLRSDGRVYWLAHRSWSKALTAHLSDAERHARHAALAALYGDSLKSAPHLFAADQPERAVDLVLTQLRAIGDSTEAISSLQVPAWDLARLLQRALASALALQRPPRDIFELQRWVASLAVASDDAYYWQTAPAWLERARHDSGLAIWERLSHVSDPGARLTQALQTAFERYNSTLEAERVCRPDEAIRSLVQYVAVSIAISFRSYDTKLVASLAGLLEPFAPLSPAVAAIYQNAVASRELRCNAQPERALVRWMSVYESLGKLTAAELPIVDVVRRAIASGLSTTEAALGLATAERWTALVDADQMQAVQAMYLRKVMCLQQGDWAGAEEFRKRAEHLSLQSRVRPMFLSSILVELIAHARAADLTGVKQLADRIAVLAEHSVHWRAGKLLAAGLYKHLAGQLEEACADFEVCLQLSEPDDGDPTRVIPFWLPAVAGLIETLVELGQHREAHTLGTQVLARCREREIVFAALEVERSLALADAKLGDFASAVARVSHVIDAQKQFGVSGLLLGASYEVRARIAIWARDEEALTQFGALTAREYRRGVGSPLGARYERLMDEARTAFPHRVAALAQLDLSVAGVSRTDHVQPSRIVSQVLRQATTAEERAAFALSLLCEHSAASGGYLYLVTQRGFGLACSRAAADPTPETVRFARMIARRELEEVDAETIAADTQPLSGRHQLPREALPSLRPIALTYVDEGQLTCVGVALLTLGADSTGVQRVDPRLAAALAEQLVAEGDARGCTQADLVE